LVNRRLTSAGFDWRRLSDKVNYDELTAGCPVAQLWQPLFIGIREMENNDAAFVGLGLDIYSFFDRLRDGA
jgi:hypothetical protein